MALNGINRCPECLSTDLTWHCTQDSNSGVVDGKLRMHDVNTVFYLGCNHCSETLGTLSGDEIAAMITDIHKMVWCPTDIAQ